MTQPYLSLAVIGFSTLLAMPATADHSVDHKIDAGERVSAKYVVDDTVPTMLMITKIEIDKRKKAQWANAWKTIRESAIDSEYEHPTFVAMHKNVRWMATPLNNYGDIDRVFAERQRLSEEIGSDFTGAISMFEDAELSTHTFIAHHDPALSYHHKEMREGQEVNIDTVYFKSGKKQELTDILSEYKAVNNQLDRMDGYDVYWNTVGSNQMSVTFISEGESLGDFVRRGAPKDKKLRGHKATKGLISRLDDIVISTESERADRELEFSITKN